MTHAAHIINTARRQYTGFKLLGTGVLWTRIQAGIDWLCCSSFYHASLC